MPFLLRILHALRPPRRWNIPVLLALGVLAGLGGVTFVTSNAVSYLSDSPTACVNCHVMSPEYATWQRGSHGRVATCNDCHVPHDNPFRTYAFKAKDGSRHAYMFTFRLEPQVIVMHEAGREVVQENCIRCHSHVIGMDDPRGSIPSLAGHGDGRVCWDCHRNTPHGRVHSLASAPYARVPVASPVIPAWIDTLAGHTR